MITPRSLINIYNIRYIDYQNDLSLINLLGLNHGKRYVVKQIFYGRLPFLLLLIFKNTKMTLR